MDDLPKDLIGKFEAMGFDKATDHFMGFYNGKSVKLYIFKGDKNTLGIFTSVKFKSENEATKAAESYSGDCVAIPRENWVEMTRVVELDVFEEYRKPDFEKKVGREIDTVIEEARKLKMSVRA